MSGDDTWDRYVDWLDNHESSLVLVGYAFDEMPLPLRGTQEAEIRESYKKGSSRDCSRLRKVNFV